MEHIAYPKTIIMMKKHIIIMDRLSTGVYGLDELMYGGFIKNTVNTVVGTTGCGKTIFCMQYLIEGLENGEYCVYISSDLEESEFLRLGKSMGWDLKEYVESKQLKIGQFQIKDASFLDSDLTKFIKGTDFRIAIDAFSPLVASADYQSRSEVAFFFKTLKESGTVVVTLEEPFVGEPSPLTNMSIFLADSVIQLKNVGVGEMYSRTLRVVKHRMSKHADGVFPFRIVEGAGIVIENKRSDGFEPNLDDLNISEEAKEELRKLANRGYITKEDIEKIRRRVK